MQSILLTGSSGHGKDSTADVLVGAYGYTKLALADPLRWEVAEMLAQKAYELDTLREGQVTDAEILWRKQLFGELKEHGSTKDLLRGLLRWWGTEVRRAQDDNYWVDLTKAEIEALWQDGRGPFVITDVSFANEMNAFPTWFKVRVIDPRKPILASEHASERGRAELPVDYTLFNKGSLADLRDEVEALMLGLLSAQAAGGV